MSRSSTRSRRSSPHLLGWVRESLGEAGVLVQAALLAGAVVYLLRRGPLPLGAVALVVMVPAAMITAINDEYRFIPAALAAGVLAEIVVRTVGYGLSRVRDAVVAFAEPALFFAAYFGAVAFTDGIGWSFHLWLGAIFTAGVIGLLSRRACAAAHGDRRPDRERVRGLIAGPRCRRGRHPVASEKPRRNLYLWRSMSS